MAFVVVLSISRDHRFDVERWMEESIGLRRVHWMPPTAVVLGLLMSLVEPGTAVSVARDKVGVLTAILAFGVASEGLRSSGFFRSFAGLLAAYSKGNSLLLVVSLFTFSSVMTLFTTNDVVVLSMIPVAVQLCSETGLENSRILIASQFVAANTLSMATLTGSPTNIIVSQGLGVDYIEYAGLMWVPSVAAFAGALIVLVSVYWLSKRTEIFGRFKVEGSYTTPTSDHDLKPEMVAWISAFLALVVTVAAVTVLQKSLFWYCLPWIPSLTAAMLLSSDDRQTALKRLEGLPYGVLPFALSFFVIARALVDTASFSQELSLAAGWLQDAHPVAKVIATALVVNVFSDLPTSAAAAEILPTAFPGGVGTETIRSVLVGLNLGAYVTETGALAGIVLFNRLRRERSENPEVELPKASDLFFYSAVTLLFSAVFAGLAISHL